VNQVLKFVVDLKQFLNISFPNENAGILRSMNLVRFHYFFSNALQALPFLVQGTPEKYQKYFANFINQKRKEIKDFEIVLLLVSLLEEKTQFETLYVNGIKTLRPS
jgi:hypothetical protein